jgi:hypothetical protein
VALAAVRSDAVRAGRTTTVVSRPPARVAGERPAAAVPLGGRTGRARALDGPDSRGQARAGRQEHGSASGHLEPAPATEVLATEVPVAEVPVAEVSVAEVSGAGVPRTGVQVPAVRAIEVRTVGLGATEGPAGALRAAVERALGGSGQPALNGDPL